MHLYPDIRWKLSAAVTWGLSSYSALS